MMQAPPEPRQGVISWNMNTSCNYRCSYCTQRFLDDRGRWARDLPRFLAAFEALPGSWEIKLSGGEPFVHPNLLDLVTALSRRGFVISIVTNLSASEDLLRAFLDAVDHRMGVFSASLHLEYVGDGLRQTLDEFIDRCKLVRSRLLAGSLSVTCVATRENLPRLPGLRDRFAAEGLTFKIQPEKRDRDVIAYTDDERAQILALGGHNLTGEIAHDFHGAPCFAGRRYFILDDRGQAYPCYPARRRRQESLGNLVTGDFRLHAGARPCPYPYCNCTVPIERGMMAQSPGNRP
jgi:MoaA/NifB/PqqE/SkfB family radical SAM enzyme